MPLGPDPARARSALAGLTALREGVAAAEDDVLACLVVTGEPRPQRVLDDWLDQVADTLRALGETAADLSPALARYAGRPGDVAASPEALAPGPSSGAPDAASDAVARATGRATTAPGPDHGAEGRP